METLLLVQLFHELALKGKNRPFFLKRAKAHVRRALKGLGVALEGEWPMALLFRLPEEAWPEAKARLQDTLGVERFARVHRTPPDLEALKAALEKALEGQAFGSFRITAKRSDKAFPLTSPEIERALGAFVKGKTGAPVRLKGAEREFVVRVLPGAALLEVERHPGPGGLPPGVSGRVVALLSGGIVSPVAAYRLMRRGAEVVLVHFHPFPLLSGASREKAKALAERLARFQHRLRLHLVPFSEVQRHIIVEAPTAYRVVLYRRYMLRIAEAIAREEGALALCTGDSLGQVASQTLENLHPPRLPAPHRVGQRGDRGRGPEDRHLRHLHPPRRGVLHPLRPQAPRDPGEAGGGPRDGGPPAHGGAFGPGPKGAGSPHLHLARKAPTRGAGRRFYNGAWTCLRRSAFWKREGPPL